jgi:hypothetical protein
VTISGFTVQNKGNLSAGSFYIAYYISTNPEFSPTPKDEPGLEIGPFGPLAAGETVPVESRTVTPPTAGTYYIWVWVDRTNGVSEVDEGNNLSSLTLTVR